MHAGWVVGSRWGVSSVARVEALPDCCGGRLHGGLFVVTRVLKRLMTSTATLRMSACRRRCAAGTSARWSSMTACGRCVSGAVRDVGGKGLIQLQAYMWQVRVSGAQDKSGPTSGIAAPWQKRNRHSCMRRQRRARIPGVPALALAFGTSA